MADDWPRRPHVAEAKQQTQHKAAYACTVAMSKASVAASVTKRMTKECLCTHLQMAGRAVCRRFDERLRPLGINNWQMTILFTLNQLSRPTIKELAEVIASDGTTISRNLKPLERRGLVTIRADKNDARARRIKLTDAGMKMIENAAPFWLEAAEAEAARVGRENLETVRVALETLAHS
jgi:DNA-binding MarR family transcriptional regulator